MIQSRLSLASKSHTCARKAWCLCLCCRSSCVTRGSGLFCLKLIFFKDSICGHSLQTLTNISLCLIALHSHQGIWKGNRVSFWPLCQRYRTVAILTVTYGGELLYLRIWRNHSARSPTLSLLHDSPRNNLCKSTQERQLRLNKITWLA